MIGGLEPAGVGVGAVGVGGVADDQSLEGRVGAGVGQALVLGDDVVGELLVEGAQLQDAAVRQVPLEGQVEVVPGGRLQRRVALADLRVAGIVVRGGRGGVLQETGPADTGGIGGPDQHVGLQLVAQLHRREGVGVVLLAGDEGEGLGRIVVAVAAVAGAGGFHPHAGHDPQLAELGLVLAIAGVDVLAGGEPGGEVAVVLDHGPAHGGASHGRQIDVRTVGVAAIEVGHRRPRGRGQAQRRGQGFGEGPGLGDLVAQADLAADLDLVVAEDVHRRLQVDGVGVLLVPVELGAVGDLLGRPVLAGVVDDRLVDIQGREVPVVGAVVVAEGQALGAAELGAVVPGLVVGGPAVGRPVVEHRSAEVVDAAHDIDLVAVGLLLVRAGQRQVGKGGETAAMGRVGRVAQVVEGQAVLLHRFRVAGDVGPQEPEVVVVGLDVELAAIAEAPAMVVVAPHLDVGVGPVDGRVVVVLLDVVEAAPVGPPRRRHHQRERGGIGEEAGRHRLVAAPAFDVEAGTAEAEAGARRRLQVERAGMVVRRLVAPAGAGLEEGPHDVGRAARRQVDRAAQALGLMVRQGGLVDDQAVDRAGGDGVVLHRPASAAKVGAPGEGVEQRHAAEGGAGQVAVDAADVDEAALARVGGDRDAGYAAQGLGGVEVRVLQDGLRGLDVDQVRRLELELARHHLLAGRGHHHLADRTGRCGALGVGARSQEKRARPQKGRPKKISHAQAPDKLQR